MWDKTCGLTGLPIRPGTKVYMFVLVETPFHQRTDSTCFWYPIMLPIDSTCTEFGDGENNSSELKLILQKLRPLVIDVKQGSNPLRETAIKAAKLDETLFFKAISEGRLKIKYRYDRTSKKLLLVDFVMMRKDVVDDLCNNFKQPFYIGQNNSYVNYTMNTLLGQVEKVVQEIDKQIEECILSEAMIESIEKEGRTTVRAVKIRRSIVETFSLEPEDPELFSAFSYLSALVNTHQFTCHIRPVDLLTDCFLSSDKQKACRVIQRFLLSIFIASFMSQVRKLWMPAGFEGCQSSSLIGYTALGEVLVRSLERDKQCILERIADDNQYLDYGEDADEDGGDTHEDQPTVDWTLQTR